MSPDVIRDIEKLIGQDPAERGGMLGMRFDTGVITHFVHDDDASSTSTTYSPNVEFINATLRKWNADGVRCAGFVHSHPRGATQPSYGDAVYAATLLSRLTELDRLAMPIVQSVADAGRFEMRGYHALRQGGPRAPARITPAAIVRADRVDLDQAHYTRVHGDATDVGWLAKCRIVLVGCGGSASFALDLVRAGVGQVVLIDPDTVADTNIGSQDVLLRDVGRRKVVALGERLVQTSGHVRVLGMYGGVQELHVDDLERLLFGSLAGLPAGRPAQTLLCGFTDNFEAQSYVNRVALHFGVPHLAAGVYRNGAALEITFSAPGVTPACGRCVVGSRYRAYQEGFANSVSSTGSPYAATAHLNAMKQDIALALLQGTETELDRDHPSLADHPARARARRLLRTIGNRNLVLVRRDPDIAANLGLRTFDRVLGGADTERLVYGDVVWLPQDPEGPESGFPACPDCGGTGDLTDSVGTFEDFAETDWALRPDRRALLESRSAQRRPRTSPVSTVDEDMHDNEEGR